MLTAFRVGLAVMGGLGGFRAPGHGGSWSVVLVGLADGLILLAYLTWPGLSRRLGRLYLPLGLAFAIIGPQLAQHFQVLWV